MRDYYDEFDLIGDVDEFLGGTVDFIGEYTPTVIPEGYEPSTLFEHGLTLVGLHPYTEPEGDLLPFYVRVSLASQVAAGIISYSRNRDPRWAIVHAMMGPFYLGYLGAKAASLDEARTLQRLFQR